MFSGHGSGMQANGVSRLWSARHTLHGWNRLIFRFNSLNRIEIWSDPALETGLFEAGADIQLFRVMTLRLVG